MSDIVRIIIAFLFCYFAFLGARYFGVFPDLLEVALILFLGIVVYTILNFKQPKKETKVNKYPDLNSSW